MKKFLTRWHWWIQGAAVILLAFVVRLPLLSGSFWLDEAAQALESTRPWSQQFLIAPDFQPPLYHIVVHFLQYFSHAEWWLRLASVLPGLGSIVIMMLIVKKSLSTQAAVMVGILGALSSIHVFFSQELRPYMWAVFWAMASWYASTEWLRQSDFRSRGRWLQIMAVFNALGVLSSYVFVFWWAAQWMVLLIFQRVEWKKIMLSFGVSALFFLIWWPWFWEQWTVGQLLRLELPGWEAVVSVPFWKAIPLTLGKFLTGVLPLDITPFFAVSVGGWWLLWISSVSGVWWQSRKDNSQLHRFLSSVLVLWGVTLVVAWMFTLLTPVLAPKRVLYILPVLLVSVAIIGQYWKRVGVVLIGWFLIWQGWSLGSYWSQPVLQRENWRALVQEVEYSFSPTNTALVFAFDGPFAPWRWYHQESWKNFSTGTKPPESIAAVESKLQGIQYYEHVLVFEYLRDLTDPERKIDFVLAEWGYDEIGAITYPQIGPVRMWVKRDLYAQVDKKVY